MTGLRVRPTLLAMCALALGACGEEEGPRERVQRYIDEVASVQKTSQPALRRANVTYVAFAKGQLRGAEAGKRLATAERAIRGARARIADVAPPREARGLHGRLLAYYDQNADLAFETTLLGRYEPAARSAVAPLPRLNARFRRDLLAAASPRAQARALGRFVAGLDQILRRLRRLRPPPLLLERHGDEVRRVARTRSLAVQLRRALEDQDARRIARLLLRFRRAASQRGFATTDGRRPLRAYQERYRALNRAAADITREQSRLEAALR